MPYSVRVSRVEGSIATLEVTPEQPDCEPFALDEGFAVGLLLGAAHERRRDPARDVVEVFATGALGREFPETAIDLLAAGGGEPTRFVRSVAVTRVTSWPWDYDLPAPTATYEIEGTDPRWLEHLVTGRTYESYAYSMNGPFYR